MGSYGFLRLARLTPEQTENDIDPSLIMLFRGNNHLHTRRRSASGRLWLVQAPAITLAGEQGKLQSVVRHRRRTEGLHPARPLTPPA
jgi:hypothetical protein